LGEVARVIQYVRGEVKAGPARGSSTPATSGSSAAANVPSAAKSPQP
jgi:hypothetical protein